MEQCFWGKLNLYEQGTLIDIKGELVMRESGADLQSVTQVRRMESLFIQTPH